MKRILIILIAALFTLPLFGCSSVKFVGEKEINYTAEKPLVTGSLLPPTVSERLSSEDGTHDFYRDYSKLYKNNIKDKIDGSFHLLKTKRKYDGVLWQSFSFSAIESNNDDKYSNPNIYLKLALHEEQFEDSTATEVDNSENITLNFWIVPVKNVESGIRYRLEFGKVKGYNEDDLYSERGWCGTYFNLYYGDTCFATCHYELKNTDTKEPLTYEWFEEYLKENLVLEA